MQRFPCECGNTLFFGSSKCLQCTKEVGFDPGSRAMVVIKAGSWMKRCDNGTKHGVCNWVVPIREGSLCPACRLNRTIPDLRQPRNLALWAPMELAKRRLFYSLLCLGITLPSKAEDPAGGLAFDIVSAWSDGKVTTGHLQGVITVNLEEADDTYRQINRQQLGESNRTLLGHFRHEIGHYVWQRWLSGLNWNSPERVGFKERFGNDMRDYTAALKAHYQYGPWPGWEESFITPYAASHPWEDWAETWAHYLQIIEGLDTCQGLGIDILRIALPKVVFPPEAGKLPSMLPQDPVLDQAFLEQLQLWVRLSTALNEMSTSLGEPALYPFVITVPVVQKLRLIHHFVTVWGAAPTE